MIEDIYLSPLLEAENRKEASEAALDLLDQVRDEGDTLLDDAYPIAVSLLAVLASGGSAWPAEVLSVLWGTANALGHSRETGDEVNTSSGGVGLSELEARTSDALRNSGEVVWRYMGDNDPEVRVMAVNLAAATAERPAVLFESLVDLYCRETNLLARACIAAAAVKLTVEHEELGAATVRWRDDLLEQAEPLVRFRVARELQRADDRVIREKAEAVVNGNADLAAVVWPSEV